MSNMFHVFLNDSFGSGLRARTILWWFCKSAPSWRSGFDDMSTICWQVCVCVCVCACVLPKDFAPWTSSSSLPSSYSAASSSSRYGTPFKPGCVKHHVCLVWWSTTAAHVQGEVLLPLMETMPYHAHELKCESCSKARREAPHISRWLTFKWFLYTMWIGFPHFAHQILE